MRDALDYNGNYVQVDDDVAHVVSEIRRLWPELDVQYVENPSLDQKPYRIIERTKDGRVVPVVDVWQLDNRLLDILHEADTHKHGVNILTKLDKNNEAVKTALTKSFDGWREVFVDLIKTMGHHQGGTFTFKNPHTDEIVKVTDS